MHGLEKGRVMEYTVVTRNLIRLEIDSNQNINMFVLIFLIIYFALTIDGGVWAGHDSLYIQGVRSFNIVFLYFVISD